MKDIMNVSADAPTKAMVSESANPLQTKHKLNLEKTTVLDATNAINQSDTVAQLVKIWENKTAKRAARGAVLSTMALSLAACGGSSDSDTTPVVKASAEDAGLNDFSGTTAAELVDAIKSSDNTDVMLSTEEYEADLAEAKLSDNTDVMLSTEAYEANLAAARDAGMEAEAQAIIDEVNALLGTAFTLDNTDEEIIMALVASDNTDVMLSADEYAAALDEAMLSDNTDVMISTEEYEGDIAEAVATAEAAKDLVIADLQAQLDALLAADAALDARTLDADNETFDAGDSADYEIVVLGTTGGADNLTATVNGAGTGTLTFTFNDADDTVALTATDLSSYSAIVISAGTVDLSAVTLADGVDVTINSGVVMTAAQFLAAGSVTSTAGTGLLSVIVSSAAEAEQVAAASEKVTGVTAANFSLENAEGSSATDAEIQAIEADADTAITVAAASADPVGTIQAALALRATELELVDEANAALTAASDAADLAEAEATLDLVNNELVAAQLADGDLAAIEDAIADATTDAVADLDGGNGAALDTALGDAIIAAISNGDRLGIEDLVAGLDVAADSAALQAAKISDARDTADVAVSDAEDDLATTTAALNEAHGLAISRYNSYVAAQDATSSSDSAEGDANAANDEAIVVAQAVIAINAADAEIAVVEDADGNIVNVSVDDDALAEVPDEIAAVNLFSVSDAGVASINADVVTTNAADASKYDIAANATVTVTKTFIDDVLATFQAELDAQADLASAVEAEAAALARLGSAVEAVDGDDENDTLDEAEVLADAQLAAYIEDVADLATANTAHDALETAIANYQSLVALDEAIAALETAATAAQGLENDGADQTDLDAAELAITNAIDADPAGLNVNLDAALDANTNDYVLASVLNGDETVDTTGGLDIIDFGTGYVFTTVAADADVSADAVGDPLVLEVLLQQQSDGDGLPAGVSVWIEDAAADGSAANTGNADFTLNNGDGDLSLADLDFTTVDGWIITGTYDTGIA